MTHAAISRAIPRYTTGAIIFHWVIAALIITNLAIGLLHEGMSRAQMMTWMGAHKAIGITVLLLSILRIVWRVTHPRPPLGGDLAIWEKTLARLTHGLFYVLMIAIPFAGWAMVSSGGKPVSMFALFDFPALPVAKASGGVFASVHEITAFLMIGLIVLHLAGALKHQFIDRNGELGKMIPGLG